MSYVIWDRGDCIIFSSKRPRAAWEYIYDAKERDPNINFKGWQPSLSGNNFIALLSNYDTVYQHDKTPNYLLPKKGQRK